MCDENGPAGGVSVNMTSIEQGGAQGGETFPVGGDFGDGIPTEQGGGADAGMGQQGFGAPAVTGEPLPAYVSGVNYPSPPANPDPMHGFMWGAQNLFAGLHAVNMRLEHFERQNFETGTNNIRKELDSLRRFVVTVYNQLQAHDDFVRNGQFLKGVEQKAYEVVVTKCLPEVWKLKANIDVLSGKVDTYSNQETPSTSTKTAGKLAHDVEALLLRLAALGDERIQHVEIIGDSGRRYKSGAPRRTMVYEADLKDGVAHTNLPVPKSWKADSDARTINKNFQQITKMINEIVLARVDDVEERLEKRMERLEKKVDILNSLFQTLHKSQGSDSKNTPPEKREGKVDQRKVQEKTESNWKSESEGTFSGMCKAQQSSTQTCTVEDTLTMDQPKTTISTAPTRTSTSTPELSLSQNPRKSHQSGAKAARAAYERSKKNAQ